MHEQIRRIRNPRGFLVYALATETVSASQANAIFTSFKARPVLPLALCHDHFIGEPGGMAIFYEKSPRERQALRDESHLDGWRVDLRPLIYSRSRSGLVEQLAFTPRAHRGVEREDLGHEDRPS